MTPRKFLSCAIVFLLAGSGAWAADEPLFGSLNKIDLTKVAATDATVSHDRAVLRVAARHKAEWPGITLSAPKGHWDLSLYEEIALTVRNAGSNVATIHCRADNPGADGKDHCANGEVTLAPGQADTLHVQLKRTHSDTLDGKLFGMRGYPVKLGGPYTIDPANVTQVLVFVDKPSDDHVFEISDLRAAGHYTPPTAWTSDANPFFPFIDTFGQYRHKNWPGKTESLADMASKREAEAADLAARPGPKEWDKYGGWRTGPQLQATGFFRTEKTRGKWWLVDPDGHLFFSHGMDCVTFREETPIDGRQTWFQDFPGHQPEFEQFLSHGRAIMGHYQGKSPECFSFVEANLARKYGADWKAASGRLAQLRLRSWGLNTIGNWSDHALWAAHLTPYTDSIGSGGTRMIEGSKGYWGQFPDVFDTSFERGMRRSLRRAEETSAGDPWCIGYFSDNEMSWGGDTSIAVAALKSGPTQPAKKIFIADLQAKYGDIARLNAAWGANYESWEALLQNRAEPDEAKARNDLTAFYTKCAEQYFRVARESVKAGAPHQLYLGCRFAWVNALAAAAAAKYCDVVSYNIYKRGVANFKFNGGADVPLLVGEYHFGALDRGMFHPGLVELPDQAARAGACREYVEGALHHPQFVGVHWFQYRDEPVLGRALDEENYQIGFVDVADTPYAETIAAAREAGYHLYK
ncbi:MAG TPA: beta-agarase [Verrucomicrobiae bacterium]|jgi:hypothetical protein